MEQLSTEGLAAELLAEAMRADGKGFTITKTLGSTQPHGDHTALEMNTAAVRGLGDRYPDLLIDYPQTPHAEPDPEQPDAFVPLHTDAVITVPETFVAVHCGTAFQQIVHEKYQEQLSDLTQQIVGRLRRHEIRTARMFGTEPVAEIRITAETAESEIWTILLEHCGFYPLQWDGEVCGMAILLQQSLSEAFSDETAALQRINLVRDAKQQCCTLTVYYSMKQD